MRRCASKTGLKISYLTKTLSSIGLQDVTNKKSITELAVQGYDLGKTLYFFALGLSSEAAYLSWWPF